MSRAKFRERESLNPQSFTLLGMRIDWQFNHVHKFSIIHDFFWSWLRSRTCIWVSKVYWRILFSNVSCMTKLSSMVTYCILVPCSVCPPFISVVGCAVCWVSVSFKTSVLHGPPVLSWLGPSAYGQRNVGMLVSSQETVRETGWTV